MIIDKEYDILAGFFPELMEKTSKQIKLDSGLSHETVFRTLKLLVKSKYLKKKKVGKTNVYEFILNEDSLLVFVYYMSKRREDFGKKHSLLLKRLNEFCCEFISNSAIIFGSYTKGTETKKSDIDILIVSGSKDIERIALAYRTKYNITIKPVIVEPKDFKNIKKDNPPFYKDLVKFGIVLYGRDFFFREVYRNDKTY